MSTKVVKATKTAAKKAPARTTKTAEPENKSLTDAIIEAAQDKKAEQIVILDLRDLHDAVADYFIICEADNTTQVKAIAEHIGEHTRLTCGQKPWHVEGIRNMEWVLIDYVDVVVHVFYKRVREFYNIEQLWGDAQLTRID